MRKRTTLILLFAVVSGLWFAGCTQNKEENQDVTQLFLLLENLNKTSEFLEINGTWKTTFFINGVEQENSAFLNTFYGEKSQAYGVRGTVPFGTLLDFDNGNKVLYYLQNEQFFDCNRDGRQDTLQLTCYGRIHWIQKDGFFYYCGTAFFKSSLDDAKNAPLPTNYSPDNPTANRSCDNFSWSKLKEKLR